MPEPYAGAVSTVGICEDDPGIRRVLAAAVRQAGHDVVMAHNGAEALKVLAPDQTIDAIVMDIGLPDSDGRDVTQALKSAGQHAPVLFLTALDALHDRLAGFSAGGEDYVAKPFEVKELLARLEVLLRRGPSHSVGNAALRLDPTRHAIVTDAGEATLTPTEFRMLAAIASRPGEVVRRRTVVSAAWPDGAIVSENTIDSFVRRIRVKLAEVAPDSELETVRGVGFRLK